MLQPHTMARDIARDEAQIAAAKMRGYLALAERLRLDVRYLIRTLDRYRDDPAMHADRQKRINRLNDAIDVCEMAATGCKASAAEVAAFRAGGAF